MKKCDYESIKKIIENEEYECYGIRADDHCYKIGDICNNSHQWWQDDPGEESGMEYISEMDAWDGGELDGTCALETTLENVDEVLRRSKMYFGDHVYLIAGDNYEGGNDLNEIIIENARVLAVIQ